MSPSSYSKNCCLRICIKFLLPSSDHRHQNGITKQKAQNILVPTSESLISLTHLC